MAGYRDDAERTAEAMRGGYYHTGDVAPRDADGYITYVGRTDDVFKASRLPDLAVRAGERADRARGGRRGRGGPVAGPDAAGRAQGVRRAGRGLRADARTRPRRSCAYCREHLAPYKRIRRLEFADLPKTISGKIRRVELREADARPRGSGPRPEGEYRDDDFPGLRGS